MKGLFVLALLTPGLLAMPATEQSKTENTLVARGRCGAGSCHGFGGGSLCNDRCKECSDSQGKYKSGSCGGIGWQRCYCYH